MKDARYFCAICKMPTWLDGRTDFCRQHAPEGDPDEDSRFDRCEDCGRVLPVGDLLRCNCCGDYVCEHCWHYGHWWDEEHSAYENDED